MSNSGISKFNLFETAVLRYPVITLACVFAIASVLLYHAKDFRLDASSETLVLEGDKDFLYAQQISERYGKEDFLMLTYTPKADLFGDESLVTLESLREDLASLDCVSSVMSILDVPLLQSPPLSLKELTGELPNLKSDKVDRSMARAELSSSPLYKELLLSEDGKTTGLLINFASDTEYDRLCDLRNLLRDKKNAGTITEQENARFDSVVTEFRQYRDISRKRRHDDIAAIRTIADKYRDAGELFLGGTAMITDDMITFIKSDLKVFGTGIVLFLVIMLGIIFGRKRWVLLPMLCCIVSVVCMMGLLGLFGWEVTVISSNFISLQIILTLAIAIHLVVRYRELLAAEPDKDNRQLILETVNLKLKPCIYAALTTIAGFGSLLLSDILPVINFGWMMVAGLTVSLTVTFLVFPAMLVLMPKEKLGGISNRGAKMIAATGRFNESHGNIVIAVSLLLAVFSGIGISRLTVENSFIDYFKKTTEIYRGMSVIDKKLGGTTSLDVILDFSAEPEPAADNNTQNDDDGMDEFEEFDEFDDFEQAASKEEYWFNSTKVDRIKKIHSYLEQLEASGKVISLATMVDIAEGLNKGKQLDSLELAVLYKETPEQFRDMLIKPYVSVENNQARFWVRIKDSQKGLRRNELCKQIYAELPGAAGVDKNNIRLTGMFVLYNNMLQSLYRSQILTLGLTAGLLTGMFLILFRSVPVAIVAMVANLLPIATVLGFMGWMNMPLDMMTITIAAISLGIAVDDTIHYIHRFKLEIAKDGDYLSSMHRCHASIGNAMYYTSITIIIGFSILAMSNFIPSVYFGLLTGLAMLIALVTALTLLPKMLVMLKPFGKAKQ